MSTILRQKFDFTAACGVHLQRYISWGEGGRHAKIIVLDKSEVHAIDYVVFDTTQ